MEMASGEAGGGGDGGTGAPRWTATNAPHYKTLNPPVYSGNGRRGERSGNGLGRRQTQTFTGWRLGEYWSDQRPRRHKRSPPSSAPLTFLSFKKKKKSIVNFADERAAAIFVAG